ncbi:hypothetical protein BURKHO8Y_240025 [Burkholderia sp. 8Y]|nr:hypothetical protein BURKHO8Y_240025 [Burkholderia sp. 8Y]
MRGGCARTGPLAVVPLLRSTRGGCAGGSGTSVALASPAGCGVPPGGARDPVTAKLAGETAAQTATAIVHAMSVRRERANNAATHNAAQTASAAALDATRRARSATGRAACDSGVAFTDLLGAMARDLAAIDHP